MKVTIEGQDYYSLAALENAFNSGYYQTVTECANVPRTDGRGTVPACMACGEKLKGMKR